MLLNLSNHPSEKWSQHQLVAAEIYGPIIDLPFPAVNPAAEPVEIDKLAEKFRRQIGSLLKADSSGIKAVHVMGELTFCFALVQKLKADGIVCLASTTLRQTTSLTDNSKISQFEFARFREYFVIDNNSPHKS